MQEATPFAKGLFNRCGDLAVDCTLLLAYCEEGDNISDGIQVRRFCSAHFDDLVFKHDPDT